MLADIILLFFLANTVHSMEGWCFFIISLNASY